jgi:hypothetical protein
MACLEGNRLTSAANVIIIINYVALTATMLLKYRVGILSDVKAKFSYFDIGETYGY